MISPRAIAEAQTSASTTLYWPDSRPLVLYHKAGRSALDTIPSSLRTPLAELSVRGDASSAMPAQQDTKVQAINALRS
jgi:hypothetical protein